MADVQAVEFEASNLRFTIEYRSFGTDRGAAIRVWGKRDDHDYQLLRFDCFDNDPHYHYDPSGFDGQHHHDRAVVPDVVAWSLAMIRDNCKIMVKTAGYPDIAEQIDQRAVSAIVPELRIAVDKAIAEGTSE
ncbi:MAG: hypothetical protein O3A46_16825 [Candidatus Poribacteria bacterium]|nr:hypothetical protein [Candidatus Poribacteria bacterium]